jgi:hypothetical protein
MATIQYIATAQPATSVLHAVKCDFREEDVDDLIVRCALNVSL